VADPADQKEPAIAEAAKAQRVLPTCAAPFLRAAISHTARQDQ